MTDATDPVVQVADAVLYEGYILWPYRRSALKNRQRWTFGRVHPEGYGRTTGGTEPWTMQTQCLIESWDDTRVAVTVRFLHVVERRVAERTVERLQFVDALTVHGERHLAWEEATERCVQVEVVPLDVPQMVAIDVPAGSAIEWIGDDRRGAFVRSWCALRGTVDVRADRVRAGLHRLTVRIANTTSWEGGDRAAALRHTFVSTHAILRATRGAFVSLMDPPVELAAEAAACRNIGTWPVLAGQEGDRRAMLSSPIILYDWPRVAPESPGDLFDATEIDQMLVLNLLALTEEEQQEVRASDPRARAILDRCAALSGPDLMRLHGAIRTVRPVRET